MTTAEILRGRLENKPGVVGASIILRSGRYFDFLEPTVDMIDPTDIAWGLANTCRFGGQSLAFYSVAQHCLVVAAMVERDTRFAALMHDAAEAYTGDMVGPLKQLCPDFKAIELRVEQVVAARFGLTLPWPAAVKQADLRALRTEQRDLTAGAGHAWNGLDAYPPADFKITPWSPEQAAGRWLEAFDSYSGAAV